MTAIRMGAVCSAPTWVTNAASSTSANGAETSGSGNRGEHARERQPQGYAGDHLVHEHSSRPPDEQRWEDRPADEPARLADGEGEDLGDHEGGQEARAECPASLQHALELITAREHRQRQDHADDAEHQAADQWPNDGRYLEPAEHPYCQLASR